MLRPLPNLATLLAALALMACTPQGDGPLFQQDPATPPAPLRTAPQGSVLVERDIEAPEVFQLTESGSWDGRASLGGVWVSHGDVKTPERVLIRTQGNDNFVIGTLLARAPGSTGTPFLLSSEAAAALALQPGQSALLNVTALRPDPTTPRTQSAAALTARNSTPGKPVEPTEKKPLFGWLHRTTRATPDTTTPYPPPIAPLPLDRPYLQLGLFSLRDNAARSAAIMRQQGLAPTVLTQQTRGKTFYRVIVGPAATAQQRTAMLKTIKGAGFADAYAVTN